MKAGSQGATQDSGRLALLCSALFILFYFVLTELMCSPPDMITALHKSNFFLLFSSWKPYKSNKENKEENCQIPFFVRPGDIVNPQSLPRAAEGWQKLVWE